ncbi:zinc finger CCHC domain-containing protein 24-like isoform X2 [Odontomachus brunneus]|uniref:zinc finger CCHC domain-containing protein 24-like isoform X2 n=1 Tax=Odontomachus brunneus TaxID=486640 RepID=UPI0013F2A65E|nr:zinc finger CCHC domain-containing protein 24-like isoform X2 [Odontomachus brunneus]
MKRRDMVSCHPTSVVQRLPMQDSSRIGYRAINGMNAPNPKISHHQVTSSNYSPQMVNWVYLTVAEHNSPQSSDQSKLLPAMWNNFPAIPSTSYLQPSTSGTSGVRPGRSNAIGSVTDLTEQLSELAIGDRRSTRRPPPTYLCHLCFRKGHYIKDCPQAVNGDGDGVCDGGGGGDDDVRDGSCGSDGADGDDDDDGGGGDGDATPMRIGN